ncbi:serine hydrolase domain-containing protein [Agreia bicolorata]|uniref:Beta-lactamase class C n=1 Tax=Agreia bicolorata TaxID=110935 RepID=A0ABR5CDM9_9MICO|nr:hydrolase [Agreia bicolorata]KJC63666.1 beta-lactamase class C [Agreia bicolorata]
MNPDDMTAEIEALQLFTDAPQFQNFGRMNEIVPSVEMPPSSTPIPWPAGPAVEAPDTYDFDGKQRSFEEFFQFTETTALLMLKEGKVVYERYALGAHPGLRWISMSAGKSFVSAMVGIAISEGHIGGVDDPISDYIRVNPGSAYDGVSIRNVLQMSSGARWTEEYDDPTSDVFQLSAAQTGYGSFEDVVAAMVRERNPGELSRYNSGDTQALGLLIRSATGQSVASYMQTKLCEPLGVTSPSYWLSDADGVEATYYGLNMTARDFARLGELYRNDGVFNGRQIVPSEWVRESLTADGPHLQPGKPLVGITYYPLGYGYQWWLPIGDRGEFTAIGVYNQFIYVDPITATVIVKLSANRRTGFIGDEGTPENLEFMRALARQN